MFDADAEDEFADDVCRDETCEVEYAHPSHVFPILTATQPGRPRAWWLQTEPGAAARHDPLGLREALCRAFVVTDWPLAFCDVAMTVRNDYGSVSQRTLHRYVRRLIELQFIAELQLGFPWSAYIRANSRRRADLADLRQYMLGRRAGALAIEGGALGLGGRVGLTSRL